MRVVPGDAEDTPDESVADDEAPGDEALFDHDGGGLRDEDDDRSQATAQVIAEHAHAAEEPPAAPRDVAPAATDESPPVPAREEAPAATGDPDAPAHEEAAAATDEFTSPPAREEAPATGEVTPPPAREVSTGPLPGDVVLPPASLAAAGRAAVRRALEEDLDVVGDVTGQATVPADASGRAQLVARADGVVAGLDLVALVYDHLDPRVEVRLSAADGDRIRRGDVLAVVEGPLRSVLCGERTALNLVTHLSGVATRTAAYVDAVAGTGTVIRDTRKTTPGLRLLEKAAVRAGGGANHRIGLSDALLVKDNHVAAAGGVAAATRAAVEGARGRHVQVEVDSPDELEQAVSAGARDVLLDNFDPEQTARAVARIRELEREYGPIAVESSGGIDLATARAYAQCGVDRLAIGELTHSAPQLDLALDLDAPGAVAGWSGP